MREEKRSSRLERWIRPRTDSLTGLIMKSLFHEQKIDITVE